jgi:hypothetical protein
MNRCATCKYYSVSYNPNAAGLADCDRIGVGSRRDIGPTAQATIQATASDDQGLSAVLMVGPDFGCIHHTPKKSGRRVG